MLSDNIYKPRSYKLYQKPKVNFSIVTPIFLRKDMR